MKKITGMNVLAICLIIIAALVFVLYAWISHLQNTPQGKLDPRVALIVHFMGSPSADSYRTDLSAPENRRIIANKYEFLSHGFAKKVASVQNIIIPDTAGDIPARVYTPKGTGPFPIIVFYHGGGWVLGTLDESDNLCKALANKTSAVVISVDYRLAPEHVFPAAVDDAYTALVYISKNASRFDADASRIAVAGDSAGGNIAAVVSQMARDKKGPDIDCQILIYPVTDLSRTDSYTYNKYQKGFFLTRGDMQSFISLYTPNPKDRANPYASPLCAQNFSSLPPALIITAEFDVLRAGGELYAKKLSDSGVAVKLSPYSGVFHGFVSVDSILKQSDMAVDEISALLKTTFAKK